MIKETTWSIRNQTILQVILDREIPLPLLGFDPKFRDWKDNSGLSMVELGDGSLVHPGITLCDEGMTIFTKSDNLENFRKYRLKELLEDHQADCTRPLPPYLSCRCGYSGLPEAGVPWATSKPPTILYWTAIPFPPSAVGSAPTPAKPPAAAIWWTPLWAINPVKRFVADMVEQEDPVIPEVKSTGKRLAIVGGGPSGLSAAYYSALKGT